MKKVLFTLLMVFITIPTFSQIDVTIGSGTATSREIPVMTIRAYTYTQQIYLQSEINRAGTITKIRFYMVGNIPLTNSNKWTIYLGHVGQSSFSSTTDWIPVTSMTQVFSGYVSSAPPEGWYEIALTTPFTYNGTQNLVVAVDENQASSSSNFGYYARVWTPTVSNRGLWSSSGTNPNPASPPSDAKLMSIVNQIQFEMLIPVGGANPTNVEATPVDGSEIDLTWTENASRDMVMVAYNTSNRFGTPINGYNYQIGDTITGGGNIVWFSGTESFNHKGLNDDTEYFYKVWSKASYGGFSSGVEVGTKTICANFIPGWTQEFDAPTGYTFPTCWTTGIGLLTDSVEFESDPTDTAYEWWNYSFAFDSETTTKKPMLHIMGSPGNGYTRSWLMSPAVDLGDSKTMYLQFDKAYTLYSYNASCDVNGSDDKFAVVVSTNRGASWHDENVIRLWDNDEGTTSYVLNDIPYYRTTETISLDEFSDVVKIGFYGESTVSNANNALFIDNVSITPCPKPTEFNCTDTTATSAILNWHYEGPANVTFEIYYDYESIITAPDENTTPTVSGLSGTSYTASELSSGTNYRFYIRASNSYGDKSIWTDPFDVTTLQGVTTVPYTEGFETLNHGWTIISDFTNKWYVSNKESYSGDYSAYISQHSLLYSYSSSVAFAYLYKDIQFPESSNPFKLTFYWKCGGTSNDRMNVYLTSTDVTPDYNLNYFSTSRVGRMYYNYSTDWSLEEIDLPAETYSNKTFRLVFGWENSSTIGSAPPATIDDINIYINDTNISTDIQDNIHDNINFSVQDKTLIIKSQEPIKTMKIYNVQGLNIVTKINFDPINNLYKVLLQDGIYIVNVESQNSIEYKKILIK